MNRSMFQIALSPILKMALSCGLCLCLACHEKDHSSSAQNDSNQSTAEDNSLKKNTEDSLDHNDLTHPKKMLQVAKGDFDCDGVMDSVRLNTVEKTLNIFVEGSQHKDTLSLDLHSKSDDGLCADTAGVDTEALDLGPADMEAMFDDTLSGYKASKTCMGFYIYDDQCGSFHYYYNHNR